MSEDNASGFAALDAMLAMTRALPRALTDDALPEIADALRADLAATIAAGTTPHGTQWAPRKDTGARAMPNVADAVSVTVDGGSVLVRVTGAEALHHRGAVKGGRKRQVIYQRANLPARVMTKVSEILDRQFAEHMAGAGK